MTLWPNSQHCHGGIYCRFTQAYSAIRFYVKTFSSPIQGFCIHQLFLYAEKFHRTIILEVSFSNTCSENEFHFKPSLTRESWELSRVCLSQKCLMITDWICWQLKGCIETTSSALRLCVAAGHQRNKNIPVAVCSITSQT